MTTTVSENSPPQWRLGVSYWERSEDPFHAEAFPLEYRKAISTNEPRRAGWMAIDYVENPIGFVADGTECELAAQFEKRPGPYGHQCAFRHNA